jgi:hypothetical protein
MNNTPPLDHAENIITMFAQLNQQDVEEFYLVYQFWYLQHQIEILQNRLDHIHTMMIENKERIQQLQPTAVELATLARLQSNGVSDVDLLDRMLERGEAWLDRTMQRLDYLEQVDDFIREDYTQWCKHALEGAYDWIDSVLDSEPLSSSQETLQATSEEGPEDVKQEELIEATEELFLQKISAEDALQANEITSKRAAVTVTAAEEDVPSSLDMPVVDHREETQVESFEAEEPPPIEPLPIDNSQTFTEAQPFVQVPIDTVTGAQTSTKSSTHTIQVDISTKRPGFMKRFLGKIWGS